MTSREERMKNLKVAYIGGGSRGWAWGFMKDLAMDEQICGTIRLYDIDRSAAERNQIIGRKISAHPAAKARWEYEVSGSLKEALTGADFVQFRNLFNLFVEELFARQTLHFRDIRYTFWGLRDGFRIVRIFENFARGFRVLRRLLRDFLVK
jgi:hypothetical protein